MPSFVRPPGHKDKKLRHALEVSPYSAPYPYYQGQRILVGVELLQECLRTYLLKRGFIDDGEGLVYSWGCAEDGAPVVAIARHEVAT